ncbi:hypothetical protein ELE36_14635 [Pseudolysobacter antarcticus]|uniref:CBU-0592-like domain-containing protein n=1 Tax=Pseudolysobacter antarcticus TaxID=2511995 RepID=A0A411HLW7_9GAMM|nr:hypothetical protein [Pseudolysobacter antarcticus]QBB71493.1 hypothetical protein ELE36_14635 [Pseudolysobacter antarcticus]
MSYHWYDFCGNLGVVVMLVAYFLLQAGKVASHDVRYLLLNAGGAVLVLISLCYAFNLSAFVMEACWVLVSVYGLVQVYLRRNEKARAGIGE